MTDLNSYKSKHGAKAKGASAPAKKASKAPSGVAVRRLAAAALVRIENDGAYANLVLGSMFDRADPPLSVRDKAFATELVYGTTRQRRSCDWYVDRFVTTDPDPDVRALLRLGAYQILFMAVPAYAAVAATVAATPIKTRGFVNAVLRNAIRTDHVWPSVATELSYPDWIVDQLEHDLGDDAVPALRAMNDAAVTHHRPDGYTQDLASQWVSVYVDAQPADRVLDLCAAPGGKATALAHDASLVVGLDVAPNRTRLIAENAVSTATASSIAVVQADGAVGPFRAQSFDRVLVDAPCSGLGSLRRRPDARWRIDAEAVERLAELQRSLLVEALRVLRPNGTLVYSVCTLTRTETIDIDTWLAATFPELVAASAGPPDADGHDGAWTQLGRGWLLLPQNANTDGMFVLRLRRQTNL